MLITSTQRGGAAATSLVPGPEAKRERPTVDRREGTSRGWRRRRAEDRPELRALWLPSAPVLTHLLATESRAEIARHAADRAYRTAADQRGPVQKTRALT